MAISTSCLKVPEVREDSCTCRNYNLTATTTSTAEPSYNLPPKLPDISKFNFAKCMPGWTWEPVSSFCAPCPPNTTTTTTSYTGTSQTTVGTSQTPIVGNATLEPTSILPLEGSPWLCLLWLLLILLIAAIVYRCCQHYRLKRKSQFSIDQPSSQEKCKYKTPSEPQTNPTEFPLTHHNPARESVYEVERNDPTGDSTPTSQGVCVSTTEDETRGSGNATEKAANSGFGVNKNDEPPEEQNIAALTKL